MNRAGEAGALGRAPSLAPDGDTASDEAVEYRRLFDRYTEASDGKRRVAEAVDEFMRRRELRSVVDIGAGNGDIARYLAQFGHSLVLVEPNPAFAPRLRALTSPTVRYLPQRAQRIQPAGPRSDVALMSYLLDSIAEDELATVCTSALGVAHTLLGVTYAEDSPWRRYSSDVESLAGPCLIGGERRLREALGRAGYRTATVNRLDTVIEAESLDDLFITLGFFYRRKLAEYAASRDQLIPKLAEQATGDTGREWRIIVTELLFTIESGG